MRSGERRTAPELWGGVECTVNRVRDHYHDQLRRSEHLERLDDVDRFAELGLTALRVPVLWERSCAAGAEPSFAWVEPLLARVQANRLRPIVGLLHHGSGPPFTDLMDPAFPAKLAEYAGQVAAAFPEVRDYTPVNEPLTTARFSALYGHWYPHERSTGAFLLALVHQCRGIQLAMRAIRRLRPDARLVQTEDIGSVRSTPALRYQADYENARRYLGLDLLCGRVDRHHPLYDHLRQHGIDDMLAPFLDEPCPPDLVGVNYYLTSDRYLDEELSRYPTWSHGGNGRHRYADIDAGQVEGLGLLGHERVLRGVWDRYHIPLALTEVHAACTREEQLRWCYEAWRATCELRDQGIPVDAVTSWALLGSYDWNSLVCTEAGVYETGAFDLRGARPRPTAVANMLACLARTGRYQHPVLASPGWWHRKAPRPQASTGAAPRPILITGAGGRLASEFERACAARGLSCVALTHSQLDITRHAAARKALRELQPWAVINCAGGMPDHGQEDSRYVHAVHAQGPVLLAEACKAMGVRLLTFSSNQVFGAEKRSPYLESDRVQPRTLFGQCQAHAERCLLDVNRDAFVVRSCALFGGVSSHDRLQSTLIALARTETELPRLSQDICSPTFIPHLVHASLDLLIDGATGLWHLANIGEESWSGLLQRIAGVLGLELLQAGLAHQAATPGDYAALSSVHGSFMPGLETAVDVYLRDAEALRALATRGPRPDGP